MENRKRKTFIELSKAKIKENRNIVISSDNQGNIVMAQQLVVNEGGRETLIFMKGAIEIDKENIFEIKKAIDEAIIHLELVEKTDPYRDLKN